MSKLSHSNDDFMAQLDRIKAIKDGELDSCCGHASDCAVHNMPAYPNGPCNCGFAEKQRLRDQLQNAIRCCNDPENCNNSADADCMVKIAWLADKEPK